MHFMTHMQLETVSQVINAFGGPKAMAKVFGGVPSRFSNYRGRGRFPASMHMRLYVECKKRNLNVAPELVGMPGEITAEGTAPELMQMAAE